MDSFVKNGRDFGAFDFKENQSNTPTSYWDKLAVAANLASAPVKLAIYAASYAVGQSVDKPMTRLMVSLCQNLSIEQLRILVPIVPLRLLLNNLVKRAHQQGLHGFNRMFPGNGFSARWIHETPDRTPEDLVLIYLHGGGYYFKTNDIQADWIIRFAGKFTGLRVSVLQLDYTVSPFAQYPQQLIELANLWNSLSCTCKNIGFLGDSAGGNLAIAFGMHLNDPIKTVPLPKYKDLRPSLALFCSPWVSQPSIDDPNRNQADFVSFESLEAFGNSFCGKEGWNLKYIDILAYASMEEIRQAVPAKTAIVWGGRELLASTCRRFAEICQAPIAYEEPLALHDCVCLGFENQSTFTLVNALQDWLTGVP